MMIYLAILLIGIIVGRLDGVIYSRSIIKKRLYSTPMDPDARALLKSVFKDLGGKLKKVKHL